MKLHMVQKFYKEYFKNLSLLIFLSDEYINFFRSGEILNYALRFRLKRLGLFRF